MAETHQVTELYPEKPDVTPGIGFLEADADLAATVEQREISVREIVNLFQKRGNENVLLIEVRVESQEKVRGDDHRFQAWPTDLPEPGGPAELTGLDELPVADITYIRLEIEFVYLAVVLDAFSRRVIGWALDGSLEDDLAIAALRMALRSRSPGPVCCITPIEASSTSPNITQTC